MTVPVQHSSVRRSVLYAVVDVDAQDLVELAGGRRSAASPGIRCVRSGPNARRVRWRAPSTAPRGMVSSELFG